MKRAIVTICCGEFFQRFAQISHPTIRAYAERIGADFIVWDDFTGFSMPHYKKFELPKLLDEYDRVMYLDTDIAIRPDAPDIFQVVPEDCLGMHDEGQYFAPYVRQTPTIQMMHELGIPHEGWDGMYYNAGVIVLSKIHRNLFVRPQSEPDVFKEQTLLNVMIAVAKPKMFSLPHQFNRMCFADGYFGEQRFASYFLHYAGLKEDEGRDQYLELMKADVEFWRKTAPDYRYPRCVGFVVLGDLYRQLSALPTLRYAYDVLYRDDLVVVVSDRADLLGALGLPAYSRREEVPEVDRYRFLVTQRGPADPLVSRPAGDLMHPAQRFAIESLGIELPVDYRGMPLGVSPAAQTSLAQKLAGIDTRRMVLVHAGKGRENDTFAPAFWQVCVDALVDAGCNVALVGDCNWGDCPAVKLDRSRVIDLADRLSLSEIVALVEKAVVLVTNDSPLLLIAGSFRNWIGLVAPSRPTEFVMPWRQGSPVYRTGVLEQGTTAVEQLSGLDFGKLQGKLPPLRDRLPSPEDVVQFVTHAMFAGYNSLSRGGGP